MQRLHLASLACETNCLSSKPGISSDWKWRISMKTMILAAFATLGLGVGGAFAAGAGGAGAPAGWVPPPYGAQAFSAHPNETATQFLGPNTVLGKMFRYNSDHEQMAATTTSAKGG
jgi:hypothetical protein